MSRKNTHRYTAFKNQDASSNFDNKNNPTDVQFLDNIGIQIVWTGATLLGQIKILTSNDDAAPSKGIAVQNWSELDFGNSIVIDNTNSDIIVNINQVPFKWLALQWVRTSGTGSITVQFTSKMVGG
jgi:hypothetical protein